MSKVGCPASGSAGPRAFDCSGLVIWAYQQAYRSLILRYGDELVEDVTADNLAMERIEDPSARDDPRGPCLHHRQRRQVTHVGLFIRWIDDSEFEFVNASSYAPPGSQSGGEVRIDRWPVTGTARAVVRRSRALAYMFSTRPPHQWGLVNNCPPECDENGRLSGS